MILEMGITSRPSKYKRIGTVRRDPTEVESERTDHTRQTGQAHRVLISENLTTGVYLALIDKEKNSPIRLGGLQNATRPSEIALEGLDCNAFVGHCYVPVA
jgi:hypothetical protein